MTAPCTNCNTAPRRTGDSYCRECRNAYNSNWSKTRTRKFRRMKAMVRHSVHPTERRSMAAMLHKLAEMLEG